MTMTQNRLMEAALILTRFPRLEQVLVLMGLCGTGLVTADLLHIGQAFASPLGGLLLAGSGVLFWWRGWHDRTQRRAVRQPESDTGVLQSVFTIS